MRYSDFETKFEFKTNNFNYLSCLIYVMFLTNTNVGLARREIMSTFFFLFLNDKILIISL